MFTAQAHFRRAQFGHVAWFDKARFDGDASFDGVEFSTHAQFPEAVFAHSAYFAGARFDGETNFDHGNFARFAGFGGAVFGGPAFDEVTFANAVFSGPAEFDHAHVSGDADFHNTQYRDAATFPHARFDGIAAFVGVTFDGAATFYRASFADARFTHAFFEGRGRGGRATFFEAEFSGRAGFTWASFADTVSFQGVRFETASELGPLVCSGTVDLSRAVFGAAVSIEVTAPRVTCERTRWEATAALRLRYAVVDLTDAVITQPLAVAAHPAPFPNTEPAEARHLAGAEGVRVASLRGVDAMHVVLTDTDLSECRFSGAFHLDQIRLEGRTTFAPTPAGIQWRRGMPWRWTRRRVLAEEHAWRAVVQPPQTPTAPNDREWRPGYHYPPMDGRTPDPSTVAPVYRALRKAFEDGKNEPGAADFYYGEMEMRRHDHTDTSRAERIILPLYWALSGYGLRALRAFIWLCVAVTLTIFAMMLWGLPNTDPKPQVTGRQTTAGQDVRLVIDNPEPALTGPYTRRFTMHRAEKATRVVVNSVVFRSSGQNLTTLGTYIEMLSRFAEPVLLALTALALRSRVKR
ncbi:pentapeptide repeat-containing protein [Yinghuangia aomiensis]